MKKVLSLVLGLIMMLSFVPSAGAATRVMDMVLDGEWDFKYYANANEVPEDVTKIVFEDKIQVPGAMELQGYGYPSYYFEEQGGWGMPEDDGVRSAGVYKTEFKYTGEGYIVFESVEDNLTVYLNDEKIADSNLGAIGTAVKFEGKGNNEIICVVERNNTGINKKDDFNISGFMGSVYTTDSITVEQASKKVEVKDNHLVIDGEEVVIKGIKYTPTAPNSGNALSRDQIRVDLELIKEYGFNTVWTSCAPEYFYEHAERLGLYVIDEANVNLTNVDRDMETATRRVQEMVERHFGYEAIIMWSVGDGNGNAQRLVEAVKELDSRPVAQEVNFAPDFEVFGNTGGMADWVATLGEGNVGGFVDEFADKELYYTQNAYVFDVKDSVTGETVTIDGEVENYKGIEYLGDATFTRSIDALDKYTIVTELSAVGGDRVIFENGDVKFEVRGGRARFNVGDARVRADVSEGKVAAVYADGEIQIFANNGFAENAVAEADVEGDYTVGGGETAIGYIEIYNDALSLDELLEGADESKLISRVDFEDINVKEDNSYKFLAYGGDFGDNPNSYYKSLTGIFSSTREPHPEAEVFKALQTENAKKQTITMETGEAEIVAPEPGENAVVWTVGGNIFTVSYEGTITSIKEDGKELLSNEMYPTVLRENTLSEYEMGVENYEGWRSVKAEIVDGVFYVELASTVTEARLKLAYSVRDNGVMNVSVQSQFSDNATKPTFIGFRGVTDFKAASWFGTKDSSYPDRRWYDVDLYSAPVSEMGDNYAVPQESGNRGAYTVMLHDEGVDVFAEESDENVDMLMFVSSTPNAMLEFQALDYSVEAMESADHDEDVVKEDKTYFRVGGYIAGVSDNRDYKLNDNIYGFDLIILTGALVGFPSVEIKDVYVGDERYTEYTSGVKTYVYRTNEKLGVIAEGETVVQDEAWAKFSDYTIYFAPDVEYLSDMTAKEATAEIAKDKDFSGNAITMSGSDYWAPAINYDKGVAVKGGSVTYDVSGMTNHTFSAVVGKNSIDWRSMGGGFDRNMFNASVTVTIALDGVVVEEVKDISMRGGNREVNIDVSEASTMTITVEGSGTAPAYEDAMIANAAFVPNGPVVVNFEKKDGKAEITVLNTDEESVDVVLSATENGVVTTESAHIGKGLYRTISISAGDGATVQAVITGLGTVNLE